MRNDIGRTFAWGGFVFGALVSVAANVLAARIPPPGVRGWSPSPMAQTFSAVWPLALLLSVEVLSRIAWPQTTWSKGVRYGGVGAVALFSAVISYQHIRDVLLAWNYPPLSAGVGPLVVDGLMVVSGYAMVVGSRARKEAPVPDPEPVPAPVPSVAPMLKELDPEPRPAPVPRPRVNGTKPVQARKQGPTAAEIAEAMRERGTTLTKREVQAEFNVGAAKALEALNLIKNNEPAKEG